MYYNLISVMPKAPAFIGLLDTYSGASIAYSAARRLSSTYTGALIRVRRSSDNTEQDIGYDANNVLDESALTTFVGANNGFVTTWYDQSGNGKNVNQTTAAVQPLIVSSGTILKVNTKPSIQFSNINSYFVNSTLSLPLINRSVFFVIKEISRVENAGIFGLNPLSGNDFSSVTAYEFQGQNITLNRQYGAFGSAGTSYALQKNGSSTVIPQVVINEIKGGSTASLYENNALITTDNSFTEFNANSNPGFVLNARYLNPNSITLAGYNIFQEFIYWGSDQSSNRTTINTNINSFYSAY